MIRRRGALPGEGDVAAWHLLQVVDGCRLAGKAVVGVVVRHDGGGPQLAQLAVGALELQLDGLQLCVLPSVHWGWTRTHAHTHTHTRTHARTHARKHSRTHTRTHTRKHARTQALTHTHTHKHPIPPVYAG